MPFARFEPDDDEEAFIRTIKDNYFDDTARLVFADFLEERGDPRGPYMRLQVEYNRMSTEISEMRRKTGKWPAERYGKLNELTHQFHELHSRYGGQWYGPVWWESTHSRGHQFHRGMLLLDGSPIRLASPMYQNALKWGDSVRVSHDGGGMTMLEKALEPNQICRIALSSYTAMMINMRLRLLRWLHRKTKKLPSRVVVLELGNGLSAEAFNLIATLPDRVLAQVKYIQAGESYNDTSNFDECRAALAARDWDGTFSTD